MKDKNKMAELLKYSNPRELYVVDWRGSLLLLVCPIKALVKDDIGLLRKQEIVYIDEVKVTLELVTVFIVKQRAYYYYHFEIVLD